MAKQNRKTNKSEQTYFIISLEKKRKLIGVFLVVAALLMLLSLFSYSRYDQANLNYSFSDFFKVFSTNPDFLNRAENTHNWLGIFGSYLSHFLINSTLGYFSVVIPIILFVWGYTVLWNKDTKLALNISNFFLIAGVILATIFGVLRLSPNPGMFQNHYELAGNIGDFFGSAIGKLFGVLGSIIVLSTAMFIALFIAFDLRFRAIRNFMSGLFANKSNDKIKVNLEEQKKVSKNLDKIKILKIPKKKKYVPEKIHNEKPIL